MKNKMILLALLVCMFTLLGGCVNVSFSNGAYEYKEYNEEIFESFDA